MTSFMHDMAAFADVAEARARHESINSTPLDQKAAYVKRAWDYVRLPVDLDASEAAALVHYRYLMWMTATGEDFAR